MEEMLHTIQPEVAKLPGATSFTQAWTGHDSKFNLPRSSTLVPDRPDRPDGTGCRHDASLPCLPCLRTVKRSRRVGTRRARNMMMLRALTDPVSDASDVPSFLCFFWVVSS